MFLGIVLPALATILIAGEVTESFDKNVTLFERIESIIQNGYDRIVELDKGS